MKQLLLLMVGFAIAQSTFAQDNPRPTKSRFWNSKFSTFSIKPGDILVYDVDNNGEKSELIVRVKKFGSTINFDYDMPQAGQRANVNIQSAAVNNASIYNAIIGKTNLDLKNASSIWLSKGSYRELASAGTTQLDMGKGRVTFSRGNTGTLKINFKGKEKIITLFNITSTEGGAQSFGVLTDEKNPLIVLMDNGSRMTLKEVR